MGSGLTHGLDPGPSQGCTLTPSSHHTPVGGRSVPSAPSYLYGKGPTGRGESGDLPCVSSATVQGGEV